MEFFIISCPGRGRVFLDKVFQGENINNETPTVFKCNRGVHEISMECLSGKTCATPAQMLTIKDTNPILPLEVKFTCL